mgnify:CR=1 FL=1
MTKALELTSAITDQICQELMSGTPLTKICRSKDLPSLATVHRWIAKHPSFAKQILQSRKVGCQYYLDKMVEELETMTAKDVGIIREKLQHYRWLSSKLLPSLYGDKQEVIQDTKVTITWQQPDMKVVDGEVVKDG